MSKKKKTPPVAAPSSKETKASKSRTLIRIPAWVTYGLGFVLLAVFCIWTYGEVFRQIAEENFVCSDTEAMTFVRRQSFGYLHWAARYALVLYKWKWIGGLLMAALLTFTAWLFDRCICPKGRKVVTTQGFGFLPVFALLSWMVYRGFNLYFRCEISTFVMWTFALFALAAVLAVVMTLVFRFKRKKPATESSYALWKNLPVCGVLALLAYGGVTYQALVPAQNVRISCEMQNLMIEEDWDAMADIARTAVQPSRSVAAYFVIALVQQNQLLEHVFDIPYNYPKLTLDDVGGSDEGINYIADCNLYAGLPLGAYRTSMENSVMQGPRLHHYKRMAICSILNGEVALANRYLHLISKVPFEQDFVDEYTPYVGNPDLQMKNPVFARILDLYPREKKLEQNYRQPLFLGYNAGLLSGSDATLITSVATCMYSKDLNNLLLRTNFLQQKQSLPLTVQQSLAVASLKRPGLLDQYPQVKANPMLMQELTRFITDAHPYIAEPTASDSIKKIMKAEMAKALRKDWLGSYYYYYYCGNIDQTVKKAETHGVN